MSWLSVDAGCECFRALSRGICFHKGTFIKCSQRWNYLVWQMPVADLTNLIGFFPSLSLGIRNISNFKWINVSMGPDGMILAFLHIILDPRISWEIYCNVTDALKLDLWTGIFQRGFYDTSFWLQMEASAWKQGLRCIFFLKQLSQFNRMYQSWAKRHAPFDQNPNLYSGTCRNLA